ncbi:MAG: tetratricopeptide repeat protein [Longimicrobiales bacterium]
MTVLVLAASAWALLAGCAAAPGTRRPAQAAEDVEELLARHREAAGLFEEALEAGDRDERKRLYGQAIELDPSLGKAHNNLGLIHLSEGDYGEAVRSLREAARRMPSRPEPRFNLGYTYEVVGRLWSAEEQYRAALELAPDEPDYLESLARVLLRRGRRGDEVEELLRRALALESRPEHIEWIRERLEEIRRYAFPS